MVLINKAINEVTVKLVYYGPGLCGKTTNLEKIYSNPKLENKGKMISMATETDRTLFFDFLPMELGTIAGQKVRVQLYTVPGQVFYDATRKLVLRGADGVVFVADSQSSMRESNLESLENLKTNLRLNRIDPAKIALVFQCNKRDLPNIDSVEEMTGYLQPGSAPVQEAAAIQAVGVTATLRAAIARVLDNLKNHVDTTLHDEPALGTPDMTVKSGVTTASAGLPKLAMKSEPASAPRPAPQPPPADYDPFASPQPIAFAVPEQPSAFDVEPQPASPFDAVAGSNGPWMDATTAVHEVAADEDPFGHVGASAAVAHDGETPFAAGAGNNAARIETEVLLDGARRVVRALELALAAAREQVRTLEEKL